MSGSKRPKWVNLESVTGNDTNPAAPVSIPSGGQAGGRGESIARSAPVQISGSRGSRDTSPLLSGSNNSLVDPVLEDGDIMLSSSLDSRSSTIQRRKEAVQFNQTYPGYGTPGGGYGDEDDYFDESEYEFIKHRNEFKREEHATS